MAALCQSLLRLRDASRAALIVVHHVRKSIGRHEIGSAFRGSSALHAVGDSYLGHTTRRPPGRFLPGAPNRFSSLPIGIPVVPARASILSRTLHAGERTGVSKCEKPDWERREKVEGKESDSLHFGPPRSFPAGGTPSHLTVGDFNEDNAQDLAVATGAFGGFSILLGNGDGTFQTPRTVAVENTPYSLAAGDFNSDGHEDLAVGSVSSYVSVLLGRGDGTFQMPVNVRARSDTYLIVVADFNGDGAADLAVGRGQLPGGSGAAILLGRGDGSFGPARPFGNGAVSAGIGAADFNRDGILDLVSLISNNVSGGVSIFTGLRDGTFVDAPDVVVGRSPLSVVVAGSRDSRFRLVLNVLWQRRDDRPK